ncbi:MAG: tubulin-like protein [Methanobrevibacter sp.]|jgi:hypothetical protein|uniref:ARPP-1 family domain-containing protein n=1 Tax=Methanobrevibacter sp. TaxID=66852 RepID=UPI0025CB83AA|nr:DUF6569 family protein [Methanobrevibacter sp.]MBE6498692.1 tubulin-like protein [Methanobrevibacter sp.]
MITIEDIELLDYQAHKNMAIIPIKTPPSYKFDILTLKKGFELGLAEVKECEHSTVNTLIVKNNAVTPLLLVDGEEIIGGDQNRIVNATILIAPNSEEKIPVNCTEHGRWAYKSEFKQSKYMANYRTRSAKEKAVRANMSGQQAVWDSINDLEMSRSFSSPTQAMSESYENLKVDLDEFISNFKAVDGQTGAVIIIDGEIKGFELFLNSQIYHEYHEKILKSYLIDTDINDSIFTIDTDVARDLIVEALSVEYAAKKSNGLEEAFEFENSNGLGTAYIYKDELLHMSYFKNEAETAKKEVTDDDVTEVIF